eukprot:179715_1
METTVDTIPLVATNQSSNTKGSRRIYICVIMFCCCIIVMLTILNLWQAGYLETTKSTKIQTNCNGNGKKYDDINICECYQCYSGNDCEEEIEDCIISAGSGQPFLFQEYWSSKSQNNEISPINIPIDYRVPFDWRTRGVFYPTQNDTLGEKLSQLIRRVHRKYHNVDIDNKYIVFGVGASQLTTGAYVAWSRIRGEQIIAWNEVPYYYEYPTRCRGASIYHCTYAYNSSNNLPDDNDLIREIVTVPNNPDGFDRDNVYKNQSSYAFDLVYYWPHFYESNDDLEPKSAPLSLFSLTKLSGHAATRFGWGIVDSQQLADEINRYVYESVMQISIESLRRAYHILSYIEKNGDDFFDFIRQRLKERWQIFQNILSDQNNYILRGKVGTQYGWIECVNKTSDDEISQLFQSYGINPMAGNQFGQAGYVRFNLCEFEGNFKIIMDRFKRLVDAER